ncbi:MAG: GntR family transcriptional regulator [Phormidesmis sp.]
MSVPLHASISEKLRQQIEVGQYLPGEKLPSEHQLMQTFGVSRITVRRAVTNLVNQGLVRSQQGKGVFVTQQVKMTYSLSSPLVFLEQDIASKGSRLSMDNLMFKKVRPPEAVQTALRLSQDAAEPSTGSAAGSFNSGNGGQPAAYLQKKLLRMDGAVGAVDVTYILPELGQTLGAQLKRRMTFPVLEESGIVIERIDAVIECTRADYEMSDHLEVPLGHPLIVYRYIAYTQHQKPVLHGETFSRADRFCYSLTITSADYKRA